MTTLAFGRAALQLEWQQRHWLRRTSPAKSGSHVRETSRHLLCIVRADGLDAVHEGWLPERRDVADSNPFYPVGAWLASEQDRGFRWFDGNDPLYRGLWRFSTVADTAQGSRRPHTVDERVNLAPCLSPNLLAERVVARERCLGC